MGMYEYLMNGFLDIPGYNCCERILNAANAVYGLELDDSALALAAGFGSGMAIGSVCGAVIGGVMVLSSFYPDYENRPQLKTIVRRMLRSYEKSMDSIVCKELMQHKLTGDGKCHNIILEVAKILDEIIGEQEQSISV